MKTIIKNIKYLGVGAFLYFGGVVSTWADAPAVPAGGTTTTGAGTPAAPGFQEMMIPFLAMFAVIYFLMIRPQQKKMKEQQNMLTSLQHGDEIITNSGLLGKVTGITEKVVTLEIADGVRVKMLKSQISQVVKGPIKELA